LEDDTTQEMHIAAAYLSDDEYVAVIGAIKYRSLEVPGDGG
jgi:hypothetical protein